MTTNMGGLDRVLRATMVAPAAVVTAVLLGPTTLWAIPLWLLAGLMLVTAGTGHCLLYVPLGIDTRSIAERNGAPSRLRPNRAWWGLVFVALGGLGVLHVAGVLDWNQTVGHWWPMAIIGWPIAEMLTAQRFSTTAAVVAVVGLGLLADEQHWTARGIIWSAVFVAIGAAILFRPYRRHASESVSTPEHDCVERSAFRVSSPRQR
jgi:hypothetical protein